MTNFNQQDPNINHQINQVITRQIVNNNFNVNDELVENFVESIAGILPLNADPQVKKSLILQVVIECEKSRLLPGRTHLKFILVEYGILENNY